MSAATESEGLHSAVEDLESELESLRKRVDVLERAVADIVAVGREFWRGEAAELLLGASATTWSYDVRRDNVPLSDVTHCDVFDGIYAKRWVGREGEISATISINRSVPLQFMASVPEFAIPELEDTLVLTVDGEPVPWSVRNGPHVTAEIPGRSGSARLHFRLAVDRDLVPADKDISFSFSDIRISPLPNGHDRFTSDVEPDVPHPRR